MKIPKILLFGLISWSALALDVVEPKLDEDLNYGYEHEEAQTTRELASEEEAKEDKKEIKTPSDTVEYWKY